MKALLNPKTGMVLQWTELTANMGHLQEIVISEKSEIGHPYAIQTVPAGEAQKGGFPVAEEKALGNIPSTTVEPIGIGEAPVGDGIEHAAPAPKKAATKKKVAKKKAAPKKVETAVDTSNI